MNTLSHRIHRRFVVSLFVVILPCLLHAQLLYEISGNGVKAKSYLLATYPLVNRTFLDTIPNVFTIFSRCDKVITEFAVEDYEAISALRKAALLPDSTVLKGYYNQDDYQTVSNALILTLGMSVEQLSRMKPSYLTELYRMALMKQYLGFDEERSMGSFFEQVAQQTKIPVIGLDDLGETLYMTFDREPFEYQCGELLQIVRYPEREVQLERSLRSSYLRGSLGDMAFAIESPDNRSTLSYSDYAVYAKRNLQWVKRLHPYLKEGKAFVTLNAVCLGGDKGLIALLRKEGYHVRRVNK